MPSFVYRADYATNVRYLGPYVDEIELLFFESDLQSLPSEADIMELAALANQLDLSYNVHLPLDLDVSAAQRSQRSHAIERLAKFINRAAPLSPTTHTLHLQCNLTTPTLADIESWHARTEESLEALIHKAGIPPRSYSIETLDYPPKQLVPIIEALNLSVCVDVGHLLRYGFDLQETLDRFDHRIEIFHLHGVSDGKDHLDLHHLEAMTQQIMGQYLSGFKGSVSLEMFFFEQIRDSLPCLADMMASAIRERDHE